MGTYGLNSQEIADVFEQLKFESHCEGDFSETDFIEGAKKYIKHLRKRGADIVRIPVLIADEIKVGGYPTLPSLLAHYAAIPTLITQVNLGTKDFKAWDEKRAKSDKFRKTRISIKRQLRL